jgi:hypothetical protein
MAMNSVSLVTAQAARGQLAVAVRNANDTGGRVTVVPSIEPPAPGPFDFRRSAALANAAYRRTILWLKQETPLATVSSHSLPSDILVPDPIAVRP